MKHLPIVALAFLLLFTVRADCRQNAAVPDKIQKEFVRFDQAFLPLYFYVAEGNSYAAKRAVFHLGYHWQQLRHRYEMAKDDLDWQSTFQRVNKNLDAAFFAIDANDFAKAYTQLKQVKKALFQLRTRHHIEYYLDDLYAFELNIQQFDKVVSDEKLDLLEWEDVMAMATALDQQWSVALIKRVDAELYELDEGEQWKLHTAQKSVTEALEALNEAMETADRELVAAESKNLQLSLLEVLRIFGNFEAAATYYANAQLE